jgi:hypothetical protein
MQIGISSISRHAFHLRKWTLVALLAMFGLSGYSQKFLLKANPLSLFVLTGNVQCEYAVTGKISVQLGAFVGSRKLALGKEDPPMPIKFTWIGLTPEIRYFPRFAKKSAPEGFYLAAFMRLRYTGMRWAGQAFDPDIDTTLIAENRTRVPGFGLGGLLGYQVLVKEKISLEAFAGPQFVAATPQFTATCPTCNGNERSWQRIWPPFSGMELRAGLTIGIFL